MNNMDIPTPTIISRSLIAEGTRLLRDKKYESAIQLYIQALRATPNLAKTIGINIEVARNRYKYERQSIPSRQRVAVCGLELTHTSSERVYTLANLYEAFADVEVIGAIFPKHGRGVCSQIRNTNLPLHTMVVEDQSLFIEQAIDLVVAHPYDIVHLSKPRAPNIFFGILYKQIWGAKVLMDIDDDELFFVDDKTQISIDSNIKEHTAFPALDRLDGKDWTQISAGLAKEFDGVTVSNLSTQQRHGGEVVRHSSELHVVANRHNEITVSANLIRFLHSVATGMQNHSEIFVNDGTSVFPLIAQILALHHSCNGNDPASSLSTHVPTSCLSKCKIDIIIPVFNALDDTKRCFESLVLHNDGYSISVHVVNDGSDAPTSNWLRQFCRDNAQFHLIEHSTNLGYTHAVNSGLKASSAPYVVTLNSDTIVTSGWLRSLIDCIESDSKIGVVGPLSNAASWQNVPFLRDENGNFAVNEIPQGMTPDEFASIVRQLSKKVYPRLSFINGFCFLIRREVLNEIGFMDEETFPMGYGEENDFCIRAADAGFTFAVADDAYVYHAKSKSFGHERRTDLSRKAGDLLRKKYGTEKFNGLLKRSILEGEQLDVIRQELIKHINLASPVTSFSNDLSRSRKHHCKQKTTDMHGTQINLFPPPAYGSKDYEVEPAISGPCLIFPFDVTVCSLKDARQYFPSIGIHLHLYYDDLHVEFSYFLKSIPYPFTLYISVVRDEIKDSIARHFSSELPLADVHVEVYKNRGRDIAPFLVGFGKRLLKHDFICHIHSKRSPHNRNKADWRRQLVVNLLGSQALVTSILNVFRDSPNVGLIFPEYHHSLRGQISWGTNYAICSDLAERLGISIFKDELALFPAGSMFWARTKAVSRLLDLPLTWDNFPPEAGQVDGTYAHAVERLLGEIAISEGFEIIQTKSEKQHSLIFYHPHKWPYRLSMSMEDAQRSVDRYRTEKPKRKARYAVYTAMTGGYDQSVFHEKLDVRFDYFLYADSEVNDHGFWEVRPIEYMNNISVRRSRHIKTNPHKYLSKYEIVVWIDANVVIKGDIWKYVQYALDHPDVPFFGVPHPHRDCIYEEAKSVVTANKDSKERVDAQIDKYVKEGYPKRNGLIETGFFIANLRHPMASAIFEEWSSQIESHSHRDQLSLNYALWKVGAKWLPLFDEKITLRDSLDFAILGHGKNSGYPSTLNVPYSNVGKKLAA